MRRGRIDLDLINLFYNHFYTCFFNILFSTRKNAWANGIPELLVFSSFLLYDVIRLFFDHVFLMTEAALTSPFGGGSSIPTKQKESRLFCLLDSQEMFVCTSGDWQALEETSYKR